jgi:TonB family protein
MTRLENLSRRKREYESATWGAAEQEQAMLLERQIAFNEGRLAHARETYTENSPAAKRLQSTLEYLRKQREELARADPQIRKILLDLEGSISVVKAQIQSMDSLTDDRRREIQELSDAILARQSAARGELSSQHPSGETAGPRLLERTDPEYTPEARKAGIEGKVELAITLDTDGRPTEIQLTRGLGAGLDEKAVACVKNWRFRPALRNGQPVTAFASRGRVPTTVRNGLRFRPPAARHSGGCASAAVSSFPAAVTPAPRAISAGSPSLPWRPPAPDSRLHAACPTWNRRYATRCPATSRRS